MDIISQKKLKLDEFGLDGFLLFKGITRKEAVEYASYADEAKNDEEAAAEKLEEVVKSRFISGELNGDKIEKLGQVSLDVLVAAIEVMRPNTDSKKK